MRAPQGQKVPLREFQQDLCSSRNAMIGRLAYHVENGFLARRWSVACGSAVRVFHSSGVRSRFGASRILYISSSMRSGLFVRMEREDLLTIYRVFIRPQARESRGNRLQYIWGGGQFAHFFSLRRSHIVLCWLCGTSGSQRAKNEMSRHWVTSHEVEIKFSANPLAGWQPNPVTRNSVKQHRGFKFQVRGEKSQGGR